MKSEFLTISLRMCTEHATGTRSHLNRMGHDGNVTILMSPTVYYIIMAPQKSGHIIWLRGRPGSQASHEVMQSLPSEECVLNTWKLYPDFYWRALTGKHNEVEFAHCYRYIQQNIPAPL